jgi:hypothetical protein
MTTNICDMKLISYCDYYNFSMLDRNFEMLLLQINSNISSMETKNIVYYNFGKLQYQAIIKKRKIITSGKIANEFIFKLVNDNSLYRAPCEIVYTRSTSKLDNCMFRECLHNGEGGWTMLNKSEFHKLPSITAFINQQFENKALMCFYYNFPLNKVDIKGLNNKTGDVISIHFESGLPESVPFNSLWQSQ